MGMKPSSLRPPWSSPRAATKPAPPAATEGGGTPVRLPLPHDVVFDILSWVPVKSACRFKSVCREWRALINDPAFVAAHKARAEPLLAIAADSCDEPSTLRLIDMDGHIIKELKLTRLGVRTRTRHLCIIDAGGDAPQLTSKETRRKRGTQDNPAGAFVDLKPRAPGRDPVRARGGYGLP